MDVARVPAHPNLTRGIGDLKYGTRLAADGSHVKKRVKVSKCRYALLSEAVYSGEDTVSPQP